MIFHKENIFEKRLGFNYSMLGKNRIAQSRYNDYSYKYHIRIYDIKK